MARLLVSGNRGVRPHDAFLEGGQREGPLPGRRAVLHQTMRHGRSRLPDLDVTYPLVFLWRVVAEILLDPCDLFVLQLVLQSCLPSREFGSGGGTRPRSPATSFRTSSGTSSSPAEDPAGNTSPRRPVLCSGVRDPSTLRRAPSSFERYL